MTYKNLIGHESERISEYFDGELRKKFSVKELLDGIEDQKDRIEKNPELKEKFLEKEEKFFGMGKLEKEFSDRASILPTQPKKEIPKQKILFLSANPEGKNLLKPEDELNSIENKLRLGSNNNRFSICDKKFDVCADDVFDLVEKHNAELVHISAHGTDKGILFTNQNKTAEPLDAEALETIFEDASKKKILILSACNSSSIALILSKSIEYTIGYEGPITEQAATFFTENFYQVYMDTSDIKDAFFKAQKKMKIGKNKIGSEDCPNPHERVKLYYMEKDSSEEVEEDFYKWDEFCSLYEYYLEMKEQ